MLDISGGQNVFQVWEIIYTNKYISDDQSLVIRYNSLLLTGARGLANVSPSCIQCLCESISGGPACVLRGGTCHDGVCGVFAITLPYWQDAGRPTVGLDDRDSTKSK